LPLTSHRHGGGKKIVPTGTCPECEADVYVETDADKGDTLSCDDCGTELEIVGLDPIELDIADDDLDEDDDEDEF
jgi:alpha-aminoadipate carrier protein LysW